MSQPERLGRYRIVGLLGSGAMGDVYLAEDPQIERRLAIKTVRVGGSDDEVQERKERLLREAKAAGKLIHPHVVTLFDYGEDQGVVYLAFEYVEGEDLRRRIDREPALTIREALTLIRQTADALALAHRHSIVHRDIKPANVLVTASGEAKVTDFGIAKLRDQTSNLTMSGSIIGTPHYMSPEQVKGEPLDGRSDLFSLGSVLFEMMHGDRPFQADSLTTVVYLILHHDPAAVTRQDLLPPLRELLWRMLAKNREERFARGEEVVETIDRLLAELPEAHLAAPARGPAPTDSDWASAPPPLLEGKTYALPASGAHPQPPPTAGLGAGGGNHPGGTMPGGTMPGGTMPGAMPPPPALQHGTSGTVVPTPPLTPGPPGMGTAPTALAPGAAPAAAPAAVASRPARSRAWVLAGCIALPLVLGAGALALLVPWTMDWVESRRTALVADAEPVEQVEAPGSESTAPATPDASSGAAVLDEQGASTGGTADEGDEGAVRPESAGAEASPSSSEQAAGRSAARENESADPPIRSQSSPLESSRSQASTPSTTESASSTRPTPSTPRRTTAADPPAVEPPAAEPEPVTEREPTDREPVPEQVPYDRELTTGLRLSLQVEPEESYVLLRSASDNRFTSMRQAKDYDATKRRGQPLDLPSPGVHYLMLRAEGFADHVVKLNVDPARAAVTTLSYDMGRPQAPRGQGQRAAPAASGQIALEVREGITFGDGPGRAKVEVDGEDMGQLRRYQDGKLLRLGPGRHRVVVSQGTQRFELEVSVSAGAPSDRQVVTLGGGD